MGLRKGVYRPPNAKAVLTRGLRAVGVRLFLNVYSGPLPRWRKSGGEIVWQPRGFIVSSINLVQDYLLDRSLVMMDWLIKTF